MKRRSFFKMLAGCVGIGGAGLLLKDSKAENPIPCPYKPKSSCPWWPNCASKCPLTAVPKAQDFPVGSIVIDHSNEHRWVKLAPNKWAKVIP